MNSPGNLGLDNEAEVPPDPPLRKSLQCGKPETKSLYVYYRVYSKDGPIESSGAIYSNDPNIGCVPIKLIPRPHTVASVKRRLCKLEGLNVAGHSDLLLLLSAEKPLDLDTRLSLSGTGPGSSEREPMALVVESDERCVVRKSSGHTQVANSCPITYLYYRIFSDDDDLDAKTSFDEDDSSLGRINVLSITPPHSVASIKASVMKVEGLHCPGVQAYFTSDEALDDGPVSLLGESFPGCNEDEPMTFVYKKVDEEAVQLEAAQKVKDANDKAEVERLRNQLAEMEEKHKREAEEQALRVVTGTVTSGRLHTMRDNMYKTLNEKSGNIVDEYLEYTGRSQQQWIITRHGENWRIQSAYNLQYMSIHGGRVQVSSEPRQFKLTPANGWNTFDVRDVESTWGWPDLVIECRN